MKLSTDEIKKQMSAWLSSPELVRYMEARFDSSDDRNNVDALKRDFVDGSKWGRYGKEKLKEDLGTLLRFRDGMLQTDADVFMVDQVEVKKLIGNPASRDCVMRTFIPKGPELGDTFRLEVITDPTDSVIVIWNLSAD